MLAQTFTCGGGIIGFKAEHTIGAENFETEDTAKAGEITERIPMFRFNRLPVSQGSYFWNLLYRKFRPLERPPGRITFHPMVNHNDGDLIGHERQ